MTNVTEEFGIAHSIVSQAWRAFETIETTVRGSAVVTCEQ